MRNEERLIDVMADLLAEVHELRSDMKGVREEVAGLRADTNGQFDRIDKSVSKINLLLSENTHALMKLADFNDRIVQLERHVFKKAG